MAGHGQRRVVLASHNPGKLAELSQVLAAVGFELIAQCELGVSDVPETASTFVENALIKARNASLCADLPAVADDSGLVVPALGGAPGIYSARYAGENATDADNNRKLIAALRSAEAEASGHDSVDARAAYFLCCLVYLEHAADPVPSIATAQWHGRIIDDARGDNGFGYDPHFIAAGADVSSAQLATAQKNRLSHRAQAARLLVDQLSSRYS